MGRLKFLDGKLVVLALALSRKCQAQSDCAEVVSNLHLSSPPYDNYFIADCHSSAQVVVASPVNDSAFARVGPRVNVAWPAGNSGAWIAFRPASGGSSNSLGVRLLNSTAGSPLGPVYEPAADGTSNPLVGVTAEMELNSSATLDFAILGSIRTIRDNVEGGGILQPEIQDAIQYKDIRGGGVSLSRLWLDNKTTMAVTFSPLSGQTATLAGKNITFGAGKYLLNATFNYPQLKVLSPHEVLQPSASSLIEQQGEQVESLAFLSYSSKLLAGGWRFLTYFGRDSMISALLLEPVLSQGKGGAIEAVIAAVLERVNSTDGSVCHEEVIGDYATWTNLKNGISSSDPQCDYKMIDTEYYLPVLMERYFVQSPNGSSRVTDFLSTNVSFFASDAGKTYGDMAALVAQRIMEQSAPFAAPNNQTKENLMHLKDGVPVGQWRDSNAGLGGGRIPFDVNTALVPASLRAIASLARAGVLPSTTGADWATLADDYADVWEDETLAFFDMTIPQAEAKARVAAYVKEANFSGPDQAESIDGDVAFPAIALDGDHDIDKVAVLHTDTAFRLFFVNSTDDTQLSAFINNTAKSILRPFPAGLMTDVGLVVANPAYGNDDVSWYAQTWTEKDYHGTVVWSFQLSMMARGLELQLSRCEGDAAPGFCDDEAVLCNAKAAYKKLWDVIDANRRYLSGEVWTWSFRDGTFNYIDLAALSTTESDIVQLWSLTFLAVTRNSAFAGGCSL